MALDIETSEQDGLSIVKVGGEVDLYSSPELRLALKKALPGADKGVAVDLSGVPYMDSSGVATLVEGMRTAKDKNIEFVLLMPSEPVLKVLQLSRLDSIFDIRGA